MKQIVLATKSMSSRGQRGMMLVDCLVYIALLALLLSWAFMAFYQVTQNTKNLSRNASDIIRVLKAGERWRADVRSVTREPRLEEVAGVTVLRLPQATGAVLYTFRDGTVFRQVTADANPDWTELLPKVKNSRMHIDPRHHVTAWRWEVELQAPQKAARVRPLFTFQAVAAANRKS